MSHFTSSCGNLRSLFVSPVDVQDLQDGLRPSETPENCFFFFSHLSSYLLAGVFLLPAPVPGTDPQAGRLSSAAVSASVHVRPRSCARGYR